MSKNVNAIIDSIDEIIDKYGNNKELNTESLSKLRNILYMVNNDKDKSEDKFKAINTLLFGN